MDHGIRPSDIVASTAISRSALYSLFKKNNAQRHHAEPLEKHGAVNMELQEPKGYMAKRSKVTTMELTIHCAKHGRLKVAKIPDDLKYGDPEFATIYVKTCLECKKEAFRKGLRVPFVCTEDARRRCAVKKIHLTETQYFWIRRILGELTSATQLNGKFNSTHEGHAVLLKEVDQLWNGVKENLSQELLAAEAIQVAAMVLRFLLDLYSGTGVGDG